MQDVELFADLPELDRAAFDLAEAVIERGRETFVEVGLAIMAIQKRGRDERIRRGFPTFEQYILRRWGWSRQRGYQLIEAAQIVQEIAESAVSNRFDALPPTDSHARALAPLKTPEAQRATWAEAVRTSAAGKPSVADLRRIVKERAAEDRAERLEQPVPVPPAPPGFEYEPETTNLWHFRQCDPRFGAEHPGRIPGQIVVNLLHLYTEPGELVLDLFAGSGTTIDACQAMGRECAAFDLAPRRSDVRPVDALMVTLDELPRKPRLVFLDPPYWRQKRGQYTDFANDLSNVELAEFYGSIEQLARQIARYLAPDGRVALIVSQARVSGTVHDLAFGCATRFAHACYQLEERIIVPYENAASQTPFWARQARQARFLLRAYRDLMVFRQ